MTEWFQSQLTLLTLQNRSILIRKHSIGIRADFMIRKNHHQRAFEHSLTAQSFSVPSLSRCQPSSDSVDAKSSRSQWRSSDRVQIHRNVFCRFTRRMERRGRYTSLRKTTMGQAAKPTRHQSKTTAKNKNPCVEARRTLQNTGVSCLV